MVEHAMPTKTAITNLLNLSDSLFFSLGLVLYDFEFSLNES
jgi:hypothetical protein